MLIYWLMLLAPAGMALSMPPGQPALSRRAGPHWAWLLTGMALVLLIGLRHQVGGDWPTYEEHYEEARHASLLQALGMKEPGYQLLLWAATRLDAGVHASNLVCAVLFTAGLLRFCRAQPRPWLALCVAVPYMVIVLGMGYTRQGVALGLAMMGLVALQRGRNVAFVLCLAVAATFHKSAVLLVPLAVLATPRGKLWTALWVGVAGTLLYWSTLADSVDALVTNYVNAAYASEGAAVRVWMNVVPALLLLGLRRHFQWAPAERNLWTMLAVLALATLAWLTVSRSSTAVDRVALYLIPLQLYVLCRLPQILGGRQYQQAWTAIIIGYAALVQSVWLLFGVHSRYWVPYKFFPWEVFWR